MIAARTAEPAPKSSRGRLCSRPLSHHRTCFIASGGSPKNRQHSRVTASCLGHFLASAGEGSALWPNPGSFTAFAQPAVPPFGVFCLHRLSHEPLKFLPSSTFGPSRHSRADTITSADSCRLNLSIGVAVRRLRGSRSPQVRTLTFSAPLPHLPCQPLIASGFAVTCQLARLTRPRMGFVFIKAQLCLRLPSHLTSR